MKRILVIITLSVSAILIITGLVIIGIDLDHHDILPLEWSCRRILGGWHLFDFAAKSAIIIGSILGIISLFSLFINRNEEIESH